MGSFYFREVKFQESFPWEALFCELQLLISLLLPLSESTSQASSAVFTPDWDHFGKHPASGWTGRPVFWHDHVEFCESAQRFGGGFLNIFPTFAGLLFLASSVNSYNLVKRFCSCFPSQDSLKFPGISPAQWDLFHLVAYLNGLSNINSLHLQHETSSPVDHLFS